MFQFSNKMIGSEITNQFSNFFFSPKRAFTRFRIFIRVFILSIQALKAIVEKRCFNTRQFTDFLYQVLKEMSNSLHYFLQGNGDNSRFRVDMYSIRL